VPVKIDERWITTKYICNRAYSNKGSGYAYSHTPDLKVLVFTPEKIERAERKTEDGHTEQKGQVFRGYDDFIKSDMAALGMGYHLVSEETDEIDEIAVSKRRYKATPGGSGGAELAFLTWVFEGPDQGSSIAVQYTVIEDRLHLLQRDLDRSLNSFRFIERNGESAISDDLENPLWTRDRSRWMKLEFDQRVDMRKSIEKKRRDLYVATAGEGWFTRQSKRYFALSHADKKYTKRVLAAAESMRSWMDKNIGEISDEYVMTGVIRICRDYDEFKSYRDTSSRTDVRSFSVDDREIVDYHNRGAGTGGGGFSLVAGGLFDNYLYDKDSYIYTYLPLWMHTGLQDYFGSAQLKGRRLVFKQSTAESVYIKEAERNDSLLTAQTLMSRTSDDWPEDSRAAAQNLAQVTHFVRFLIDGPGARMAPLKDFVPHYMTASIAAGEAWNKQQKGFRQAQTEEEEEQLAKARATYWPRARRFILDHINKDVVTFSDDEWKDIEKAWFRYLTK